MKESEKEEEYRGEKIVKNRWVDRENGRSCYFRFRLQQKPLKS